MNEAVELLIWAVPLFFAAVWCSIFFVIARWGGWRSLAAAYPSRGVPAGETFRMRSAGLRAGCNYNNCITFTSSSIGLHMAMPVLFRFQHAALFIPWGELPMTTQDSWFGPVLVLTPTRCPNVAIKLQRTLAEQLLRAAGQSIPDGL